MALLLNVSTVKYLCACNNWESLCTQYFCRHCLVLRCGSCVCHEVDSIYCSNCLENMPIAEARLKKNKCTNCMECPICSHALSVRATSASSAASGEVDGDKGTPGTPRKVFYLVCLACQWTSRQANIADQSVVSGSWPDYETPNAKMLNGVIENLRQLAAVEKSERERKRYTTKRKSFMPLFPVVPIDRSGSSLQQILARKRMGVASELAHLSKHASGDVAVEIEPSDVVPELPDSVFTEPIQLDKSMQVTTLKQRFRHPDIQPVLLSELYPAHKQLAAKRSQRCKICDHNLCKAEFNPSSIKFKIQLCGLLHVPEIRLLKPPTVLSDSTIEIQLTVCNLTANKTTVFLLPDCVTTGANIVQATIPTDEIVLPVRDDSSEYPGDEVPAATNDQFKDDPNVVIFRKWHKVGLKLLARKESQSDENYWLHFIIKFDYLNNLLLLTGEQKEPEILWLQQHVKINLGKLS